MRLLLLLLLLRFWNPLLLHCCKSRLLVALLLGFFFTNLRMSTATTLTGPPVLIDTATSFDMVSVSMLKLNLDPGYNAFRTGGGEAVGNLDDTVDMQWNRFFVGGGSGWQYSVSSFSFPRYTLPQLAHAIDLQLADRARAARRRRRQGPPARLLLGQQRGRRRPRARAPLHRRRGRVQHRPRHDGPRERPGRGGRAARLARRLGGDGVERRHDVLAGRDLVDRPADVAADDRAPLALPKPGPGGAVGPVIL